MRMQVSDDLPGTPLLLHLAAGHGGLPGPSLTRPHPCGLPRKGLCPQLHQGLEVALNGSPGSRLQGKRHTSDQGDPNPGTRTASALYTDMKS